jgi:nicotinamidase-related amidase|tara:strand:- start:1623 stop:2174 length:552 start_codon:yes stop_codon:yes gene_type:complete
MPRDLGILTKNNCILLVVDVQEKFRKVIFNFDSTISNITKLIKAFQILKIPIIATEQYPKGLGKTITELNDLIKNKIEKVEFSCFDNNNFKKIFKKLKRKNIIVAGIESHVCVLRTILDGVKNNYTMHLVADAVSSRKPLDKKIAVERAKQSSAFLTTTEAVIFQLISSSKEKEFKEISRIIK